MSPRAKKKPATKAGQSEATRSSLLRVARKLFTDRGFLNTGTEEIVRRAGVTRGALYHHFKDKEELFRGVFEEIQGELATKLSAAAATRSEPLAGIEAGCLAFLDACLDPSFRRVALLDGPSVLGWQTWQGIDNTHGLKLMQHSLQAAMDAGAIEKQPAEPLAHLLVGALNQAGLLMARSEDPARTRGETGPVIHRLLEGLRPRS